MHRHMVILLTGLAGLRLVLGQGNQEAGALHDRIIRRCENGSDPLVAPYSNATSLPPPSSHSITGSGIVGGAATSSPTSTPCTPYGPFACNETSAAVEAPTSTGATTADSPIPSNNATISPEISFNAVSGQATTASSSSTITISSSTGNDTYWPNPAASNASVVAGDNTSASGTGTALYDSTSSSRSRFPISITTMFVNATSSIFVNATRTQGPPVATPQITCWNSQGSACVSRPTPTTSSAPFWTNTTVLPANTTQPPTESTPTPSDSLETVTVDLTSPPAELTIVFGTNTTDIIFSTASTASAGASHEIAPQSQWTSTNSLAAAAPSNGSSVPSSVSSDSTTASSTSSAAFPRGHPTGAAVTVLPITSLGPSNQTGTTSAPYWTNSTTTTSCTLEGDDGATWRDWNITDGAAPASNVVGGAATSDTSSSPSTSSVSTSRRTQRTRSRASPRSSLTTTSIPMRSLSDLAGPITLTTTSSPTTSSAAAESEPQAISTTSPSLAAPTDVDRNSSTECIFDATTHWCTTTDGLGPTSLSTFSTAFVSASSGTGAGPDSGSSGDWAGSDSPQQSQLPRGRKRGHGVGDEGPSGSRGRSYGQRGMGEPPGAVIQ